MKKIVLVSFVCFSMLRTLQAQELINPNMEVFLDQEALEREINYQEKNLDLNSKIRLESEFLYESLKEKVSVAYQHALDKTGSHEQARQDVMEYLREDLLNIDQNYRDLFQEMVTSIIDSPYNTKNNRDIDFKLSKVLGKKIQERSEIVQSFYMPHEKSSRVNDPSVVADNREPTSPKNYQNMMQLATELAKDKKNERWVLTANTNIQLGQMTSNRETFSVGVKVEFMGVSADFGPTITFWKEYSSRVSISAEGTAPFITENGVIDLHVRDAQGRPVKENGVMVRRFMIFNCEVDQNFGTEYSGEADFQLPVFSAGIGPVSVGVNASAQVVKAKSYTQSVSVGSRRIQIPDTIEGKQVTVNSLAQACFGFFPKALAENGKTIQNNLDLSMKYLISGLKFKHPKTSCVEHSQCNDWYNDKVIGIHKYNTVPRCAQQNKLEGIYACELRGARRANCAVVIKGERVSSGLFEYTCDKGLTCKVVHEGGWFQNWSLYDNYRGECL